MSSEDDRTPRSVVLTALRAQGGSRELLDAQWWRQEQVLAGVYFGVDMATDPAGVSMHPRQPSCARTNRKQKRARCKQRRRERLKSTRPAMHDAWLFDGAAETPVTFGGGAA